MDDNGIYSGETMSISFPFSGHVSNGSKTVLFAIPLGRRIYANTITFEGALTIRGVKGYFTQASYDAPLTIGSSGYTFNYDIDALSGNIWCEIIRSSAFGNVTNNTPISVISHSGLSIYFGN